MSTEIHQNPFLLLGASPRDDRRRIVELAESKSLSLDSEVCSKARADLTNPRNRVAHEIAWLPPERVHALITELETYPASIWEEADLPRLALANLMASAFELVDPASETGDWATWIYNIGVVADDIAPEEVLHDINDDRAAAGLPQIKTLELIESALEEQKRRYKDAVLAAVNRVPTVKLVQVFTESVEFATNNGESDAPDLIHDLVDAYRLAAHNFLERERDNALKLVGLAKQSARKDKVAVAQLVKRLEGIVRNWDMIAQPIQLSMKSRGLDHDLSYELAGNIRNFGIELFNEYGMLEAAERVTRLLQGVFAEVPEAACRLSEDAQAIEGIIDERQQVEQSTQRWAEEITYEADVGTVFKNKLRISPEGVSWKSARYPLDAVTRVRWGGVRHSVNGIPSGSTYSVAFGDEHSETVVELRREEVYSAFLERLWKGVCVRLMGELLTALRAGERLRFADSVIDDRGMELSKRKLFGANERKYWTWAQVSFSSTNGSFIITAKDDKKFFIQLSYVDHPNTHILEACIRAAFKKFAGRLSGLLDKN